MISVKFYENINKIRSEFQNLSKIPKNIIKYGCLASLICFLTGASIFILNSIVFFSVPLETSSISLVKCSFTLFAEAIIGGLVFDFLSQGS